MASKIVQAASKTKSELWGAFKSGISIKGYQYYQPPAEIKYRYPAPGSCALSETDHFNLYKNDWKEPFRTSEYNTTQIEKSLDDLDPL